jgi:hypothetical protein
MALSVSSPVGAPGGPLLGELEVKLQLLHADGAGAAAASLRVSWPGHADACLPLAGAAAASAAWSTVLFPLMAAPVDVGEALRAVRGARARA